jgi:hypothetical protein
LVVAAGAAVAAEAAEEAVDLAAAVAHGWAVAALAVAACRGHRLPSVVRHRSAGLRRVPAAVCPGLLPASLVLPVAQLVLAVSVRQSEAELPAAPDRAVPAARLVLRRLA